MNKNYIDYGKCQIIKYGEELCGDSIDFLEINNKKVISLCDGLGSGVKGFIASTLTSKIGSKMFLYEQSVEEIVKTIINSLPSCKIRGISYSTFTFIKITDDYYFEIINFDNPNIIIKTKFDYKKEEINIEDYKIVYYKGFLEEEDYICAFSDGVVHAGAKNLMNFSWSLEKIHSFIEKHIKLSCNSVCKKVISTSNHIYQSKPFDDASFIMLKKKKMRVLNILTGPPLEKTKDDEFVNEFLNKSGYKIICGGTSSKIVARILNEDIKILNLNSNLPPTYELKGIDLVTEGAITLQKVDDFLDKYINGIYDLQDLYMGKSKDEVDYKILEYMIEKSSKINIFLGRKTNKAHENIIKNIKLRENIIENISSKLKRLGKIVEIRYY